MKALGGHLYTDNAAPMQIMGKRDQLIGKPPLDNEPKRVTVTKKQENVYSRNAINCLSGVAFKSYPTSRTRSPLLPFYS